MHRVGTDPTTFPTAERGPGGWSRHGQPLATRLWSRVQRGDGCWEYIGSKNPNGYGQLNSGTGGIVRAHRAAWEATQGPIPAGACVCHTCDNPACVRPSHLFLGSRSDNMRDAVAKGRHRHAVNPMPGERHPLAKIDKETALAVKSMRADGVSGRAVARIVGLSPAQVSRIHTGKRWAHV